MSVNLRPSLEIRIKGKSLHLFASVATAAIICSLLCGTLALIAIVSKHLAEDTPETASPLVVNHTSTTNPPKPRSNFVPLNVISVATSPLKWIQPPVKTNTTRPQEPNLPTVDRVVVNDLEIEALDFDNPFTPSPPTQKKVTPVKPTTNGKGVAKKSTTSNSKTRTAILAKKIAREASLISRSTPSYPRSARKKGLEGRVVVTVTIGTAGKIASSYVSKSSGHPTLDHSALAAARRFRFKPAINGLGQHISVKRAIPFNFQITG